MVDVLPPDHICGSDTVVSPSCHEVLNNSGGYTQAQNVSHQKKPKKTKGKETKLKMRMSASECVHREVLYEAAAEASGCHPHSDQKGHLKVEPPRTKLFTSQEKNYTSPLHSAVNMQTQPRLLTN